MLIIISYDALTNSATVVLQALYPAERTLYMNEMSGELTEKDGTLPKRLTFLGHGGKKKFGNKNVDEFSIFLANLLNAMAKNNDNIKTTLSIIDLLGCGLTVQL